MQGKITVIKWVVVEVKFDSAKDGAGTPKVYDALVVDQKNSNWDEVVIEVLQLLEDGVVRGIAMDSTDGIKRWDLVTNTWEAIKVPVGPEVLGHMFNVLWKTIDGTPDYPTDAMYKLVVQGLTTNLIPFGYAIPIFESDSINVVVDETV